MSQGTPRKFSEKIAILERKQNEEQEMFHNVMRDVRAITSSKTPTSPISPAYPPSVSTSSAASSNMYDCSTPSTAIPQSPMEQLQHSPNTIHPLTMAWNRCAGGSLPNVHQMLQQPNLPSNPNNHLNQSNNPPIMDYNLWNNLQMQNNNALANMNQMGNQHPGYQQHMRTRSPGSATSHYHPYMNSRTNTNCNKSTERIPPVENHIIIPNIHLQPPDSQWSNRARSDPNLPSTIHMNSMGAPGFNDINYGIYQTNWSPDCNRFLNNPTNNGIGSFIPSGYQMNSNEFTQNNIQQQIHQQQKFQNHQPLISPTGSSGEIAGSLPNMHTNLLQQAQLLQQRQIALNRSMQANTRDSTPVNNCQPLQQQQIIPQMAQQTQLFLGQRLATPFLACESSQSAPTSPAQTMETNPLRQQWPPPRTISTSPDSHEIPNIVLTGTDGSLDCFQDLQDLHLDNDLQQLLSNSIEQLDPALETQLLN